MVGYARRHVGKPKANPQSDHGTGDKTDSAAATRVHGGE